MDGLGAEPDEEIRRYWKERNRVRFARIAATPPSPEKLALLAEVERRANHIPLDA